jgi:hypothetical protein
MSTGMPRPSSVTVHRAVGVQDHFDPAGPAGQGLVDGVVDHLIDHVVQARAVVGVADVHPRPLAHRVQALQDLDALCAVFSLAIALGGVFGGLVVFAHHMSSWRRFRRSNWRGPHASRRWLGQRRIHGFYIGIGC